MRELDYDKIGQRIRQVRKVKGLSQGTLAQQCNISMSFLGHIERGSRVMSMETFVAICGALDIGADGLLWGSAQPSGAVLDMMEAEGKDTGEKIHGANGKQADCYAMYIKIMKSVAEIMNES